MARYSKRDREDAAIICSIASCNAPGNGHYVEAWTAIEASFEAGHLAEQAMLAALASMPEHSQYTPLPGAEAEALIRTGWSP